MDFGLGAAFYNSPKIPKGKSISNAEKKKAMVIASRSKIDTPTSSPKASRLAKSLRKMVKDARDSSSGSKGGKRRNKRHTIKKRK